MNPTVDQELCTGCGLCEDLCPDVFEVGPDGFSHPIVDEVDEELYECVREAAEECPTQAISTGEEESS